MTTFQDPQPQSRRAVRQSERGESAEQKSGFTGQASPAPQFYSDPSAPRDMWDTTARRAAQLPSAAPHQEAPPAGRRAAAPPTPVAEPLSYTTQQRPAVPSYDGPSFRNRAQAPETEALPPTQAIPQAEQPSYRVRDFSPEGRRAAAPLAQPSWGPIAPVPSTDLDYQTEARAPQPISAPIAEVPVAVAPAPVAVAPAPIAPVISQVPAEHTLSRRELRAMQQSGAAEVLDAEVVQAEVIQAEIVETEPAAVEPATAEPAAELSPFDALFRAPAEPQPAPAALVEPILAEQAPEPSTNTALTAALSEFDALASEVEPSVWTPPVGHWSTQADLDDELPENTISRTIGSGHTATNALVLPVIPQPGDLSGPLSGTGEIMLTGSIDLPQALASTGESDRFDNGGIDALFDLNDAEVISTDSSPVRAIRAVSTHTSGHGVTHTQKPKGTRALTALLIAACSMAVVVAGLFVAAVAFNLF